MRLLAAGFAAGSLLTLACWGVAVRHRADEQARPAAPPAVAEPEDAGARRIRRSILEHRLAALAWRETGGVGATGADAPAAADADVNRWIMAALAEGGPMTLGEESAEDWINSLLGWVAHDRDLNHADLEFAPLRERFVAGWLASRGSPLTPDQRKEFEALMADAEGAFARHLAETAGKPDEERLISGLRATADWDRRLATLLSPEQHRAIEPLAIVLDQWRWQPACEPRPVDPAAEGGWEPVLAPARARFNPGDFDRARPILEDHGRALVAMHREVHAARLRDPGAVSDVEEFIRYLEIRVATRKRLIAEGGIRPEDIAPEDLMDCAAPFEEAPGGGEDDR